MGRCVVGAICASLLAGCGFSHTPPTAAAPTLQSGIETQYFDTSVRPQDDLYQHVNGKWLASFEIPADKPQLRPSRASRTRSRGSCAHLIEGLQRAARCLRTRTSRRSPTSTRASWTRRRSSRSAAKPLAGEFARIEALRSKRQIPALIAHLNRDRCTAPYTPQVHQDAKDSTHYVFDLGQDGLGMPDRDYYLQRRCAAQADARTGTWRTSQKMLTLAGDANAAQRGAATSWRSRPRWRRCSGPRSRTAIRSRPTTSSSSRKLAGAGARL